MDKLDTDKIIPIFKKSGVTSAGVFGSYARGEQTDDSDIDLLVQFKEPIGLFSFAELKSDISKTLGKPVDLVTYNALHPRLKDKILSDVHIFYEAK